MTVLPDCMMPDGADPCKGYQAQAIQLTALRDALRELWIRADSFWAFIQGEYVVHLSSEDQEDHNVSEFFAALAKAKALVGNE